MKSVLISIRPKWCELISSGKKTLEVRKTRPKLSTPFKVYIYCTKDPKRQFCRSQTYAYVDDRSHNCFDKCGNGMVIGEFICDCIFGIDTNYEIHDELPGSPVETWLEWNDAPDGYEAMEELDKASCLSYEEIKSYVGVKGGYGWHISDLKIYDKPKELSDFRKPLPFHKDCSSCDRGGTSFHPETCYGCGHFDGIEISRPPQSWCYVEELTWP